LLYLNLKLYILNMKPLYLKKNTQSPTSSFLALKTEVPHIYDKWHYHKELELLYVIKGSGTRFIGDSVQEFDHGDMVLVGPNLPHVWKSDKIYYTDESLKATVILIQFVEDFMGRELLLLPEMQGINELISNSVRGIKLSPEAKTNIGPLLETLVSSRGSKRIILLLEILQLMSEDKYELLSSNWFSSSYMETQNSRINKVYDYIIANFDQKITLNELAGIAHMNNAALCRYFKASTKKTVTEFINELRIGYAYNLIHTKNYSVTQACFESGFNNLSYFHRQFKKKIGHSPSVVKKNMKQVSIS